MTASSGRTNPAATAPDPAARAGLRTGGAEEPFDYIRPVSKSTRDLRVGIVEDETLMRSILTGLVDAEPHMRVVHSASGFDEARRIIEPRSIDIAMVDVDLGDGNGVALSVLLQRADPRLAILLLSSHDVMDLVLSVKDQVSRPWSYLSKKSSLSKDVLLRALVATARGQVVLDPFLTRKASPQADTPLAQLTDSQISVLRLVAEGFSNTAVAGLLGLSPRSVENHLLATYKLLGVSSGESNPRVMAVLAFLQQTSRY